MGGGLEEWRDFLGGSMSYPIPHQSAMSSIDFLIGTTGAGFTNQIFMRPGGKVVVITCSACFPSDFSKSMVLPSKPHGLASTYFGLHVLYYVVDIPFQSLKFTASGHIVEGSLGIFLPDVKHFWSTVLAFFREVEENLHEYIDEENPMKQI